MNKKEDKKHHQELMIIVIGILIIVPIFSVMFVYMFFSLLLQQNSFVGVVSENMDIITVIIFALYIFAFSFVAKAFIFTKPKKTETLGKQSWKTVEEQKEFADFKIAKIDMNEKIEKAGMPINKINEYLLIYDTGAVHSLNYGSTRSGKTRKLLSVFVMLIVKAGESAIFHDNKGELYRRFHKLFERFGYTVNVIDFRFMKKSQHWNPLKLIVDCFKNKKEPRVDDADQFTDDFVNQVVVDNGQGERIWIDGQKAMIKSIILAVVQANIKDSRKNLFSVYQVLSVLGKEVTFKGEKNPKMLLTAYINSLEEINPARVAFTPIANSPDKTRGSFMTSTLSTLAIYNGQNLAKLLSESDFSFSDYADGKHVLFIINPDENSKYNPIVSVLIDQAYQELVRCATATKDMHLKKRLHFLLDETGNMAPINQIQNKLTVALSRWIFFHLFLQDDNQLDEVYGEQIAKIIRGNCNLKTFISSADMNTCKAISEEIGNETLWVASQSGNFNNNASQNGGGITYNQQQVPLIDPNVLRYQDVTDGKGIIVTRTYFGAMQNYLPDMSEYKWYKELEEDDSRQDEEDRKISYAVPRYIIYTRADYDLSQIPNVKNNIKSKTTELVEEDMYWYWSQRDDLASAVKRHINAYVKSLGYFPERKELLNYMNSEQFFEFINQIDVPHINAQKENSASHIKDIQKEMSKTSKSVPKMSLLDKINELNSNDLRKAFESINTIRGNK
ncbi:type IV secretory system conjugative DNA transfer family protein [Coprobacillus sp. OF03-2AA]|nr:type IV secretory system conjugative DNA transfer family protein [Coprobacillus sp. OF03-2AA]